MSVRYTCKCGANIRMPASAAGKRARCRECGTVFTVPAEQHEGEETSIPLEPARKTVNNQSTDEVGSWLEEFSKAESDAVGESPELPAPVVEEYTATPTPAPRSFDYKNAYGSPDEDRDWITGPSSPFWQDLAGSFIFFMDPGNLITFMVIAFINFWSVLLSYAGPFGFIGQILVMGYLCAFYMSTIRDTASGEDELPNMWISSMWDDILVPLLQFVGTWSLVLLPSLVLELMIWHNDLQVTWPLVEACGVIGLFFWPVVILGVALGGGFRGLWPHVVVRTVIGAPLAYLAVCVALAVAAGIMLFPQTELFDSLVSKLKPGMTLPLGVINCVLSAYSMIVAMRVIGLFYRHYKHKFPWVAE